MTIGREQSVTLNVVVSSGSGTGNFTKSWDHVNHIRVIPPSESDTYDFKLLDGNGYIIFATTIAGMADHWIGTLPISGPYSLGILNSASITSASSDGTYKVILDFH